MLIATIQSSAIKEAAFNPESGALDITYRSGNTYRYHDVSRETFEALTRAASAGHYVARFIRGHYRETKLD